MTLLDTHLQYLGISDILVRLTLATFIGLILGIDRQLKSKPVDFRAYVIVAVATALVGTMSVELSYGFLNGDNGASFDFGKAMAGVLTGIGFLGAGAIIRREDDNIVGTSTGAAIWAAGILGLLCGVGQYIIALCGFGFIFATLFGLGYVSRLIDKADVHIKGD